MVVVGDLNVDLMLYGDDLVPEYGQVEKLIDGAMMTVGGSGSIFACGAARLGLRVAVASAVGDDDMGRYLLGAMESRGVDVSHVRVLPEVGTGLTVHFVADDDRAMLTSLGTLAAFGPEHIDTRLFSRTRHVHGSSFFLLERLRSEWPVLLKAARWAGATVSLDANFDPAADWSDLLDLFAYADVLLPNETEAMALTGMGSLSEALMALADRVPVVAVKAGSEGAYAQRNIEEAHARPPMIGKVIDSIGAGDSFDAGFVYGLLHDWPLLDCLKLGVSAGTLSLRAAGGVDAQPTLDEALRMAGLGLA